MAPAVTTDSENVPESVEIPRILEPAVPFNSLNNEINHVEEVCFDSATIATPGCTTGAGRVAPTGPNINKDFLSCFGPFPSTISQAQNFPQANGQQMHQVGDSNPIRSRATWKRRKRFCPYVRNPTSRHAPLFFLE